MRAAKLDSDSGSRSQQTQARKFGSKPFWNCCQKLLHNIQEPNDHRKWRAQKRRAQETPEEPAESRRAKVARRPTKPKEIDGNI